MATFDNHGELRGFLRELLDAGELTTLPFIDAKGNYWLSWAYLYEEYGLGCYLVGAGVDPRILQALDSAKYPIVMLVEPTPGDPWKCPRCGDWYRDDSDDDRAPICDSCLKETVAKGDDSR